MKKSWFFLGVSLALFPLVSDAAQTAQARMFCLSLRVQRGTALDSLGTGWTLDMTTLASGINGELAPDFFGTGYSNSTYVEMHAELWGDFSGAMAVDVPDALCV